MIVSGVDITTLGVTFDIDVADATPKISTSVTGYPLDFSTEGDTAALSLSVNGKGLVSVLFDATGELAISSSASADGVSNLFKSNWVAWGKIGEASFIIDRTNDSGQRPMSWNGYIYQILQLGKDAIVYGSGGITRMYPVGSPVPTFGFEDLQFFGLKNQTSVCGDKFQHFFIDETGKLKRISSDGLETLGYEEFLKDLTNPIILYDPKEQKVFISDSSEGFIYHHNALGGGYGNITGLVNLSSSDYFISPGDIIQPATEIITHELDFGVRGLKDIESIEIGADSDDELQFAVEYRYKKSDSFSSTGWVRVSPEGFSRLKVSGLDFRIKIKTSSATRFVLYYININIKYSDRRFKRSIRG